MNTVKRFIWFDGKIVDVNDAKINVLSPTSQFGLNVFEGIRCYWNKQSQQLYAFRLEDHLKRLKRSQKLLQTLFVDGFGSWSSASPVNMIISPIQKAKTNPEYNKKGLNCCISSWRRISDSSLSPRIKCGANYINSRMAQLEALKNGYDTAIFLNAHETVSEGPGSCLFMVKDGVLYTPLLTDSVLESITRDTVMKISKVLGIDTIERSIDRTELYTCDEAFLCGSAMEITPIFSIDKYAVGDGAQGKITKKIHVEYLKIVTGAVPEYLEWLTPIY